MFFIRYLDPDSHIRIRFHLTDVKHISEISVQIHNSLDNYIKNGFVYKSRLTPIKERLKDMVYKPLPYVKNYFI